MNSSTRVWVLRNFSGGDFFSGSRTYYQMVDAGGSLISRGYEGNEFISNNQFLLSVDAPSGRITAFNVPEPNAVIRPRVFLEGAYEAASNLMRDDLRLGGYIPTTEPYTNMGYAHVNGGGETTTASILSTTGANAIVDWLVIELRDSNNPNIIHHSQSVLLQRDGDVVSADGESPVLFQAASGSYFLAVRHRNHLGIMSATPIDLNDLVKSIDFSDLAFTTYGALAQNSVNGLAMMWSGDVTFDSVIKYTGGNNDRDPILVAIGGNIPTAATTGYFSEDMNLDGSVKYTGSFNDRDPILVNIGGNIPTATRLAQLP